MGNHRASHSSSSRAAEETTPVIIPARSGGGRRKATRRQSSTSLFRKIPAVPTIVGALAIIAAAGGAIQANPDGAQVQLASASANSFSGTDAFNFTGSDPRSQAISRDSERKALQDAADKDLKAAVEEQSQQRNAALESLAASAQKRADEIAKNLWVLPTAGYHLTARFGQSSGLWAHNHTGLDFAAPTGTPIYAVANGVITFTGYDGSYGNKTIETLPDGTEIWYCHQSEIGVSVGDSVIQSSQIGRIGSTGNVTGPHVHIEVRPGGGDPVDPYPAFVFHGVTP
ncbi:MAG: Glycyl-glycine endopeptidase precursor [Marmoricola sp.]|nr:Glycyl-glycine endopeptidase precursor [Marmoricola sp.]